MFGLSIVPYAPLHGGLLADLAVLDREITGDQRFGAAGFSDAEIALARSTPWRANGVSRCTRSRLLGCCRVPPWPP